MRRVTLLLFAVVLSVSIVGCGGNSQTEAPAEQVQTNAQIEELIEKRCITCHTTTRITNGLAKDSWPATVDRMISKGANISVDERDVLVEYLQEVYSR